MTPHNPTELAYLKSSVTALADAFYQIVNLQQLPEISLEPVETSPQKRQSRAELLIICYLHQVKPYLEELEQELKEMRHLLKASDSKPENYLIQSS